MTAALKEWSAAVHALLAAPVRGAAALALTARRVRDAVG